LQSARLKPLAVPPLKAFAHALNCTSHDLCTAADFALNVLPLTANGREASPESVISGAAMPPRAALVCRLTGALEVALAIAIVELGKSFELTIEDAAATIGVAVADGGSMNTVEVTTSQELIAAAVGAGGSIKIVFVTTAHSFSAGLVAIASAPPRVGAA